MYKVIIPGRKPKVFRTFHIANAYKNWLCDCGTNAILDFA